MVWLPRLLIGSFNNHPKLQTIGWIKYIRWLNYHSSVFTPTNEHMAIGFKLFSFYVIVNRQCVCMCILDGESVNYQHFVSVCLCELCELCTYSIQILIRKRVYSLMLRFGLYMKTMWFIILYEMNISEIDCCGTHTTSLTA